METRARVILGQAHPKGAEVLPEGWGRRWAPGVPQGTRCPWLTSPTQSDLVKGWPSLSRGQPPNGPWIEST